MNAVHSLLRHSIDYAGLFPPAGLDMPAAVNNYLRYQAGPNAWALARFIVPAGRLVEFETVVADSLVAEPRQPGWQLSVLVGPDVAADLDQIVVFERRRAGSAPAISVAAVETKAETLGSVRQILRHIPGGLESYLELPLAQELEGLLHALAESGARAKVRTGGVTAQTFPSSTNLARFIHTCVAAGVPFKATAGLHHALRAEYRLSYEEDSASGVMFGFLNLFLATALARNGAAERETCRLLEESSPEAFRVEDEAISWEGRRFDLQSLERSRESIISFGSCSFTEPIAELQALEWLEPEPHRA